jgi:hypothetical protein
MVGNRGGKSVVLVAANEEDCIDQNNNMMIETSQNKDDLLAWGTDECVLWETIVPDIGNTIPDGPRAMTFESGTLNEQTCEYEDVKVWVGWHSDVANQAWMGMLNPQTGEIEEQIQIDNWTMGGWQTYAPYGAAMDPDGNVWFSQLRGEVFRINAGDHSLDRWPVPQQNQDYGMAVANDGKVWFGGCSGQVTNFDPSDESFQGIQGTNACHRGVAADTNNMIWVASNGPCGMVQVDGETETLVKFHNFNQCSTPVGVSIDPEGFVWIVDQQGWAWKFNPEDESKEQVIIAGNHYTYSDMTGGGLNAVVQPQ